jgi:sugar phosphate isomerase/epimerase
MATRRAFLQKLGIGAAALAAPESLLQANGLPSRPGLQLWSVKDELKKNPGAALHAIARIGFREIELYELPKDPAAFRRMCANEGLVCTSGHFDMLTLRNRPTIDVAQELGMKYIIIVFPTLRAFKDRDTSAIEFHELSRMYEKISLDDYKWNAQQFNMYGEILNQLGLQLGYHNHAVDLKKFNGMAALDLLIQSTNPKFVVFEMDCGHVIHAGADPIQYLRKYPQRIQLLHLKDLVPGYSVSTTLDTEDKDTNSEIGAGSIDWKRLFSVARKGDVKRMFIEHEGKMDRPHMEAIAASYRYIENILI